MFHLRVLKLQQESPTVLVFFVRSQTRVTQLHMAVALEVAKRFLDYSLLSVLGERVDIAQKPAKLKDLFKSDKLV